MERSSVFHISEQSYAYATRKDTINVRLRLKAHDCEKVLVYYKNLYNHTDQYFVNEMQPILQDEMSVMYESEIKVAQKHFKYYFEIRSQCETVYYTGDGFLDAVNEINCFYYPVINADDILSLPAWAQGGIIYQIVVDRFCNGDQSNDPLDVRDPHELPGRNTFYGGDFQGIVQKLDYIKNLGAEMIYLSPVFKSPSYHKYDIVNYYRIDEAFGGKESLAELIREAHNKGLKVILDAVFNHCSVQNEMFQDVIMNGKNSRYRKWFLIDSFPVSISRCNYDTFAGAVPDMPRFDTSNPEVIEYLIGAALYWTKELGIDGWRLDVADEVSHTLWREFRRKIKAYNNDVLIIGEVWNHASRWLQGDEFDTVTNYKFRGCLLDFASGRINSRAFWNKISANKMLYMTPLFQYLVAFADSHDTVRCATYLKDDAVHTLVMAAIFTMEGIALIYYGDEIGMQGGEDPDNRRTMQWDSINQGKLDTIIELVKFRSDSDILRKGRTEALPSKDRVIAFRRYLGKDSLTVILNFEPHNIALRGDYKEILLGEGEITGTGVNVKSIRYAIVR